MKYALSLLLIIAALAGAAVCCLPDMEGVRGYLAEASRLHTGKTLVLEDDPELTWSPPGIRFGRASWGQENGRPAAQGLSLAIHSGALSLDLFSLLRGALIITSVELNSPDITINPAPAAADDAPFSPRMLSNLHLDKASVRNASLTVNGKDGSVFHLEKGECTLHHFQLNEETSFTCGASLGAERPQWQGDAAASGYLTLTESRLNLRAAAFSFVPRAGLGALGMAQGSLEGYCGMPEKNTLPELNLHLSQGGISWKTLGLMKLDAPIRGMRGCYTISPLRASLNCGGSVQGTLDMNFNEHSYAAQAEADDVGIGPLLLALTGKEPLHATGQARLSLSTTGENTETLLRKAEGKGSLTLTNIDASGLLPTIPALPSQFRRLDAPFTLSGGVLRAAPVMLEGQGLSAAGHAVARLPEAQLNAEATVAWQGMNIPVTASGPFSHISYGIAPEYARRLFGGTQQMLRNLLVPDTAPAGSGSASPQHNGAADSAVQGAEQAGQLLRGLFSR